jgi:uncharacterized membrane protein
VNFSLPPSTPVTIANAWDVLMLFTIPIGGGIPAGVLLAQSRGIAWPGMVALYFVSDVLLACVFEPLMWLVVAAGKRAAWVARFRAAMKKSMERTTAQYGTHLGPLALIAIAFGVDPMTGRAATAAAGHGFFSGWALAITGDMFYFTLLMVSTIWLNGILGDGTWTTLIIMALMMIVPGMIRRLRREKSIPPSL